MNILTADGRYASVIMKQIKTGLTRQTVTGSLSETNTRFMRSVGETWNMSHTETGRILTVIVFRSFLGVT